MNKQKTLIIVNLLTVALLVGVTIKLLDYRKSLAKELNTCKYELKSFDFHYKADPKNEKILMLGNSFIKRGNWDSLLNRNDVLNRGIEGDRINCICERLMYLKNTSANICFIEGGINDLPGKTSKDLFMNYKQIVDFWKSKNKIPVIVLLTYVSPTAYKLYPQKKDYQKTNATIKELNGMLKAYAAENHLDSIDMNKDFSDEKNMILKSEYTPDGIHLNKVAYTIWAKNINAILKIHGI